MMIKKLTLAIALLMPCLAMAQSVTDSWKIHPFFVADKLQNVIDTGNDIYYLTGGNVYCYHQDSNENESLNKTNYLYDVNATGLYYDNDHKTLFIAYANGNIDLVDKNGKVTNMADILTASISTEKGINHISFDGRYAYAATSFGYVVIDDTRMVVKESRIYNRDIASIAHVGKWMVLASDNVIYTGSDQLYHESMSQYKASGIKRTNARITAVSDNSFFIASTAGLDLCTIDDEGAVTATKVDPSATTQVLKTRNGFIASCPVAGYYVTTDATGSTPEKHEVGPNEIVTAASSGNDVWGLNAKGLHKVGDEIGYYKPNAIGITTTAFWTAYNIGDKKLYLASTSDNTILTNANKGAKTEIWTYDGNTWEDATPPDVPLYNGGQDEYQGSYNLVFVPGSKSEYLFSTRTAGICHVRDGKIVNTYYFDNMPRDNKYKASIELDTKGNLVAVQSYKTQDHPVMVLPKAKLANPESVTTESWGAYYVPGLEVGAFQRSSFAIARNSDIKVYTAGKYEGALLMWDDKGNFNTTTPQVKQFGYNEMLDQSGAVFQWSYIRCLTADNDGMVWMGTSSGVVKFNPADAFKAGFHCTRPIVPRNDGTSLGDYLLDGIRINCITVDASGRKWIGTNEDGVFLVSADGTSVLKSFNSTNSPLISDCIFNICCNPTNNSVYIVTSNGVMEYFTDVVPASEDYSNVHVYPNPVRPETGSLVTIAGLMENSLVKIADAAGNVVKQLKSEGGMCTWDCCNDSGDSVRSGVYFVIASQNENGNGSSVVSKFVVIK